MTRIEIAAFTRIREQLMTVAQKTDHPAILRGAIQHAVIEIGRQIEIARSSAHDMASEQDQGRKFTRKRQTFLQIVSRGSP